MNSKFRLAPARVRRVSACVALAFAAGASSLAFAGTPYGGTPLAVPGTVQAENFDLGGEGVGYHDLTAGNSGGVYRTSESVDITTSKDAQTGGYVVTGFQSSEWLAYTVSVATSGTFDLAVRASNHYSSQPYFHMEVDGVNVTGSIPVPKTTNWNTFQWVTGKIGVPISAGQHVVKVVSDTQYFNLDAVRLSANTTVASYAGTPYTGSPIALPKAFEAENFDKGGEGVAYHDLTVGNAGGQYRTSEDVDIVASTDSAGGGYVVNSFQTGEWMNYSVSVPTSGPYDISIRAANNYSGPGTFHVAIDGADVTGAVSVPVTGSWSTFQWVGVPSIQLKAGTHVLKLVADTQYFNVNQISVLASSTTSTTSTSTTSTSSTTTSSGSTTTTSSATKPTSLLFWSGFNSATALASPTNCYSNGCWQSVTGTDSNTGSTWPPSINGGSAQFQMIANSSSGSTTSNIGNYIYNQLQTMTGHTGAQTQAMYSEILQSGCCGTNSQANSGGSTQDPYIIQPSSDVKDMYISEWVMLQSDLVQKMSSGTWRDLFEWKTSDSTGSSGTGPDFRVELTIATYGGTPYWFMSGNGYVPTYTEYWRINNTSVPVPIGKWFKLEVFWHRSSGSDGRVWMAVNGQVIGDHYGSNVGPNGSPINRIMMTQLYTGGTFPVSQWLDDVQIWSTFPTAASSDAWYNPPYAPH